MPGVYDDEKTKDDQPPTGGDKESASSGPAKTHRQRSDELLAARKAEKDGATAGGTKADGKEAKAAGAGGKDDQVGKGFTDKDFKNTRGKVKLFTKKRVAGLGIGTGLTGGVIGLLLFLLPILRLDSYLTRINERAFAIAANAIEQRAGHLLERYMVRHLLDMERCGAVVSNACKAPLNNTGLAQGLFQAWREAKVEDKLLERCGIQVESHRNPDPSAGAPRFTLRDKNGNTVTLTNGHIEAGDFDGGSRELGREFHIFLKEETRLSQVIHRRSIRKYLRQKHNIRLWCFFACKTRDDIDLRASDIKTRVKMFFTRRFVYPFNEKLGIIMDCLTSGGGSRCTPEGLRNQLVDRVPDPEFTNRIRQKIDLNSGKSFTQLVLEEIIEKLVIKESSRAALRTAVSSIPIAGQIYMAIVFVDMFDRFDTFIENNGLSHMAADINARQYIEFWSGMRSFGDEMKKGEATIEETGEMMNAFEGAEESLVYQANYNHPGQELYRDPEYKCPSGRSIPDGELVCPERTMQRTFLIEDIRNNAFVDGLADVLNSYGRCIGAEIAGRCPQGEPRKYIRPILNGIDWLASNTVGRLTGLLTAIPGVSHFMDLVTEIGTKIMDAFINKVFPLPISIDALEGGKGRELYDGLEGGGGVASAEFNKGGFGEEETPYGLGAPQMSDEEELAAYAEYNEQREFEFRQQSFVARATDMSYPGSLTNSLVDAVPTRTSQIPNCIAMAIPQMLASIANMLVGLKPTFADAGSSQVAVNNAFGITVYGWPAGSNEFTEDPAIYTEDSCEDYRSDREDSMEDNERSGFDDYTVTDPCLLEYTSIEAAGSYFTEEDGTGLGGGHGGSGGTGGGGGQLSGDARANAQAIINNPNITGAERYMAQIEAVANGDDSCHVNPTILALIKRIGESHSIYITSLNRLCTGVLTASGTSSYHWRDDGGHAVDIGVIDGSNSTGAGPKDRALIQEIAPLLPNDSGIGQANCRASNPITLPAGVRQFDDTCNHLHIQVPIQ